VNISSTPPNKTPTITKPADVTQDEDTIINVTVTVADPDDPNPDNLVVTGSSDDLTKIPASSFVIPNGTGSGATRNVIIVPNPDANGVINVNLTVTDNGDVDHNNKRAATSTFKLTLNPIEDQPVIVLTGSANINTLEDKATTEASNGSDTSSNQIEFTARDAETSSTNLTFQVTSGNTDVIPVANVVIGPPSGTGGTSRTLTITPAANKSASGIAVTVRVLDGTGLSAVIPLTVNVTAVNDAPTLDLPADVALSDHGDTLYMKLGDWFAGACLVCCIALAAIGAATSASAADLGRGSVKDRVPYYPPAAYTGPFTWTGFFSPVSDVNAMNSGRAVPLKFSLGGDRGLEIFKPGSPSSRQIACLGGAAGESQPIETPGNSGLTYDPSSDRYTYVWKTQKQWAGTCRELTVELVDGTSHTALFTFTK
jgi:hypothetical protein